MHARIVPADQAERAGEEGVARGLVGQAVDATTLSVTIPDGARHQDDRVLADGVLAPFLATAVPVVNMLDREKAVVAGRPPDLTTQRLPEQAEPELRRRIPLLCQPFESTQLIVHG